MNNKLESFEKRLSKIRQKNGFESKAKFADALGANHTTYRNYENGKTTPDANFLFILRQKFDANIDWLLTGEGEMMGQAAAPQLEPMAAVEAVDYLDPGDVTKERINTLLLESAIQHTEEMYSHEPPPQKAIRIMNSYKRLLKAQWDPGPDDPPLNDAAKQHLRGEKRKCRTENSGG